MLEPLVTIVIPVYNGSKYLSDTIESCLVQSYSNFEIIIIDDVSIDSSVDICKMYAKHNSNIHFFQNDSNVGVMKSCNKALSISNGEWILYLGQDDILEQNHLELMSKNFKSNNSLVWCRSRWIDNNGATIRKPDGLLSFILRNIRLRSLLDFNNQISSTGLIINVALLRCVGGWPENFRNYGEWAVWIKLKKVGSISYSTTAIARYRRHETNMTNSFTDPNVKDELNRYFEYCRRLARDWYPVNC